MILGFWIFMYSSFLSSQLEDQVHPQVTDGEDEHHAGQQSDDAVLIGDVYKRQFVDYANHYQLANNYVRLEASDNIAALEPFHQGALYLEQGRFPQAGEQGVCVVDGSTATQMGLSLGDTVEVEALTSDPERCV